MSVTKFQPEVWAATLLSVLAKALVYGGAGVVNRDYEGDIADFGDTVHIVSVADPTISDYTKDTDLTAVEALTDSEQLLTIDQTKAFNFQVDDIDMRQARNGGALMAEAAFRAGFGLRDKADQYLAAKMAGAATPLGKVDATTVTNVYDQLLVPTSVKLDQANVPSEGRWIIVDPSTYGKLQLDSRFIKYNESGGNALHNGMVGDAAGFRILKSNNAFQSNRTGLTATTATGTKTISGAAAGTFNQGDVGLTITGTGFGATNAVASVLADGTGCTVTVNSTASATVSDVAISGGGQLATAGTSIACTYAEQINKVEAYRPEKRFSDALKGLHLYGGRVTRPTALVVASVKTS